MIGTAGSQRRPVDICLVSSQADITPYRNLARTQIFGSTSLPTEIATIESVTSPVSGLTGLSKTERMVMTGYTSRPRVWTPSTSNGDAIILHQGHTGTYTSYRMDEALQQYLTAGFTVCGMVMPGGANETTSGSSWQHNQDQDPLSEFMGPIAVAINTLIDLGFSTIHMTGLSGGAWSTHVYAALDSRIGKSFPTAGSLPFNRPITGFNGARDWEQWLPGMTLDYLDLYALAASNGLCKQILHDEDACCFNRAQYDRAWPYADEMATLATRLGGRFELVFVEKSVHEFDTSVISTHILSEIT